MSYVYLVLKYSRSLSKFNMARRELNQWPLMCTICMRYWRKMDVIFLPPVHFVLSLSIRAGQQQDQGSVMKNIGRRIC